MNNKYARGHLSGGNEVRRWALFSILTVLVCACQPPSKSTPDRTAPVDESRQLKVMVSGGFAPALDVLAPQFEQLTGIEVVSAFGASLWDIPESIPTRLTGGEAADVIIITRPSLDDLADMGEVRPASRVDLGRSSIGAAVRSGATKPDISTTEALMGALLTAESIGYSASVSGTYLSTVVFPQLGIWERIRSKSRRIEGEYVGNAVARGEVELGFQQVSEILAVEGVDYLGPIPSELQSPITYSAGITERTVNLEASQRLIEFLSSDAAAPAIAATGLAPVVQE